MRGSLPHAASTVEAHSSAKLDVAPPVLLTSSGRTDRACRPARSPTAATPNTRRPDHGQTAVAAIAAFALGPAPAAAVTPLADCADLTKAGETYVLTADITTSLSACFMVLADRITIDLAGHTVTGPAAAGATVGIWDDNTARISTVVKNGSIKNFGHGIFLLASTRNTVRSVTTSDNRRGMTIGDTSLVKDCTVQRNLEDGIVTDDNVQVEDCYVGGTGGSDANGGFGIVGGQRMLITRTKVNGNGSGILVGMRSTVSHSTASNNGNDGIAVGQNSLVTRNTTNDNGGDGIEAVCPSTITHNTALGNDELDINAIGTGCTILHNTVSPPDPT
jgi:hypothetical protein